MIVSSVNSWQTEYPEIVLRGKRAASRVAPFLPFRLRLERSYKKLLTEKRKEYLVANVSQHFQL